MIIYNQEHLDVQSYGSVRDSIISKDMGEKNEIL